MSLVSEDVCVCVFTFFPGKIQVEQVDVNLRGQNDVLVHCPRSIPRRVFGAKNQLDTISLEVEPITIIVVQQEAQKFIFEVSFAWTGL